MSKLICLDPGHGDKGGDFGAVGADGTREADITLKIAKYTKAYLEKQGYKVIMTRDKEVSNFALTDYNVGDLPSRTGLSNQMNADLFVSIHCNSAETKSANGFEVFYTSDNGRKLASAIENEVLYLQKVKMQKEKNRETWNFANRGLKYSSKLYVLNQTDCPAVLVEALFLSNKLDLESLKNPDFQQMMAIAVSNGVYKYFKGV